MSNKIELVHCTVHRCEYQALRWNPEKMNIEPTLEVFGYFNNERMYFDVHLRVRAAGQGRYIESADIYDGYALFACVLGRFTVGKTNADEQIRFQEEEAINLVLPKLKEIVQQSLNNLGMQSECDLPDELDANQISLIISGERLNLCNV